MNLYIEIENEKPKNHPAFENNLIEAFGEIPKNWILFERVKCPKINIYETLESEQPEYHLIDNICKDVWFVSAMTAEEIAIKKEKTINEWNNQFPSWIFNEFNCTFEAPVSYPQDGKQYRWDESTINWIEVINA
jgi:hypothetical protein